MMTRIKTNNNVKKIVFTSCVLMVLITNISFTRLISNPIHLGWISNIMYIIGIMMLSTTIYKKAISVEWLYIIAMTIGFVFHAFYLNLDYSLNESIKWAFLVFLIIASRTYKLPKYSIYILLGFFCIHSLLAIIENKLQKHLFDYSYLDSFENVTSSSNFRAFGLMEHPLYSANVVLIIMSFILINNNINKYIKYTLLFLGSYALLCFNSRAAMMIWGGILAYRIFLYNKKPVITISFAIIFYLLFMNDFILFIQQNSSIFGRLASKDNLLDDSSMTRVMSYVYFWNEKWDFEDIIYGGRILYLPGTDLSLENGILLTIAWWGWIVGILKVLLEVIISYLCLTKYFVKDRIIVMIACWGCAFANNNSINTFVFSFYIITILSFETITSKKEILTELIKLIHLKSKIK